jgi:hypothetical protein
MGRKKKTGEWKPRKLTCNVCKDKYTERKPTATQRVTGVERICPKCEQAEWDAWAGKKPVINEEAEEVYREWNAVSGWGTPDGDL